MTTFRKQVGALNCVACGKRLPWRYSKAGRHPECAKLAGSGTEVLFSLLGPPPALEVAKTEAEIDAADFKYDPGTCPKCGGRVRNDDRMYHLRCENELIQRSMPNRSRPLPPANAPRARVCTVCRTRDNSLTPSEECIRCGGITVPAPIVRAKSLPKPVKLEVETLRRSDDDDDDDDFGSAI